MSRRVPLTAAALALALAAGCSSTIERERIDGVECMVVRNPYGKPRAVDCNWDQQ